jgi:transcriptional regulator with XRE-family HTH domain
MSAVKGSRDDLPTWAQRIRAERAARGWSQQDAVRALLAHAGDKSLSSANVLQNWKRWEAGRFEPDNFHQKLIARTFGLPIATLFPQPRQANRDAEILAQTGMDTLELIARLRVTDVSASTLEATQIAIDQLCSDYSHRPSDQVRADGLSWIKRVTSLLDGRLTLAQHKEVLALAGQVALLLGCVEYDMGNSQSAETSRRAALSLGEEAGHADIVGWAYEMKAWYSLTQGDYDDAIIAAKAGHEKVGAYHSVTVQLAAHRAKAWARIGDRREVELALDHGRMLLDAIPYPDNPRNHFVIDPAKFDFYTMDCYRLLGDDRLAETYAYEVLRSSTNPDGTERNPMRAAEARVTLGVVSARTGDLDNAMALGRQAVAGIRKSLPSLAMHTREFAKVLLDKYPGDLGVRQYIDELTAVTSPTA